MWVKIEDGEVWVGDERMNLVPAMAYAFPPLNEDGRLTERFDTRLRRLMGAVGVAVERASEEATEVSDEDAAAWWERSR